MEAELKKYRGRYLVFSSWGGAYQAAQRQAYADPFTEQFGINIIHNSFPTLAKIRSIQASGNVTWHVFDTNVGNLHTLARSRHLENLDFSVIDNRRFLEVLKAPYIGGGGITWSEVWAYNTDIFPEGYRPQTMSDIYDSAKFPGRRAWAHYPDAEMVFVLLSKNPGLLNTEEGRASLSALTPQQVNSAYQLFEEYRDQVDLFWINRAECPDSLSGGELDLCTGINGQLFEAVNSGWPVKICWECGHVLNTDGWGIIKGLKDQDPSTFELAQLYMAWASLPENNARMAKFIAFGPVNTLSLPYLNGPEYDHVRDDLPSSSSNLPYAIFKDEVHAYRNGTAWRARWTAFQQSFQ